jgi:hypothetical protein
VLLLLAEGEPAAELEVLVIDDGITAELPELSIEEEAIDEAIDEEVAIDEEEDCVLRSA